MIKNKSLGDSSLKWGYYSGPFIVQLVLVFAYCDIPYMNSIVGKNTRIPLLDFQEVFTQCFFSWVRICDFNWIQIFQCRTLKLVSTVRKQLVITTFVTLTDIHEVFL